MLSLDFNENEWLVDSIRDFEIMRGNGIKIQPILKREMQKIIGKVLWQLKIFQKNENLVLII